MGYKWFVVTFKHNLPRKKHLVMKKDSFEGIVTHTIMPTVVFLASLVIHLAKEFSTPLLYGIDDPYYYIQVSHLLTEGLPKYSDPPLSFYILAVFSVMLKDDVSDVKAGSVSTTLLAVYRFPPMVCVGFCRLVYHGFPRPNREAGVGNLGSPLSP